MNSLSEEIDDLIGGGAVEEPPPVSDPEPVPEPEPEPEPTPVIEEPAPNPSSDDPAPVEPSGVVEPPAATPVASTPAPAEPVADPRDSQIQQLQETIAALQKTINDVASVSRQSETPAAPAPTSAPAIKFLEKEEDLDQALGSVDNFNGLMSNVISKAQEQILAMVPQIAAQIAGNVVTQRMAVNDFYLANQDLAANKAYVGIVADEIARANPEWDMFKVMEKLADEVRSRLRISGQGNPSSSPVQDPLPTPAAPTPAFATPGNARPSSGAPKVSPLEKEISDLLDFG